MKNISTEDLIKELEKRKKVEVPRLAKVMNDALKSIRALGVEVEYINDFCYRLDNIECKEEDGKIKVYYDDEEV